MPLDYSPNSEKIPWETNRFRIELRIDQSENNVAKIIEENTKWDVLAIVPLNMPEVMRVLEVLRRGGKNLWHIRTLIVPNKLLQQESIFVYFLHIYDKNPSLVEIKTDLGFIIPKPPKKLP
jgi:hypothetical protein